MPGPYLDTVAGAAREAINALTASAGELNIMDGVTATAAQLNQAAVQNAVTCTGDVSLSSTQSRSLVTNTFSTTGVVTATLPAAAAGLRFTFLCGSTVQFIVKPTGTDLMPLGTGAFQTTGLGIAALVKGQSITLEAIAAGRWWAVSGAGTTGWAAT